NRPERPDQVPSRSASSALALCARRRSQICQVCSRRSPDETPAPRPAPGNAGRLPGRLDRPQLEYLMAERLHHLALECRPAAPAEESNSLTTAGSRACRGCLLDQPPTPQSTHPLAPPPLKKLPHFYGLLRTCAPLRYSRPRGWSRLWLLPWHRRTGFLTFRTGALLRFAPPQSAMRFGE